MPASGEKRGALDDAIVMLENIQRRIDEGETRLVAAYQGARQVAFAVVATTLTLVAVFVPISFMGGDVGRLFGEFGFTLASAVIISSIVALSLASSSLMRAISLTSSWVRLPSSCAGLVPGGASAACSSWSMRCASAF